VKLIADAYRWDGCGNLQATITLLADDDNPLFQDVVNLSKQSSRVHFARTLGKKLPDLKGRDIEGQLLQLLFQAKSQHEEVEGESEKRAAVRANGARPSLHHR